MADTLERAGRERCCSRRCKMSEAEGILYSTAGEGGGSLGTLGGGTLTAGYDGLTSTWEDALDEGGLTSTWEDALDEGGLTSTWEDALDEGGLTSTWEDALDEGGLTSMGGGRCSRRRSARMALSASASASSSHSIFTLEGGGVLEDGRGGVRSRGGGAMLEGVASSDRVRPALAGVVVRSSLLAMAVRSAALCASATSVPMATSAGIQREELV
jgi:hypothetical protein